MATDFAKIGFGVDTSQLERGVAALNTFNSSAKSANSTAKSIGAAMSSSSKVFAAAVSAMSKSIASLVSVTKGATVEQIAAAKEASDFADRVYRAAKAQDTLASSVQKTARALKDYSVYIKAASNESLLNRINRLTGVAGLTGSNAEEVAEFMKKEMGKKRWLSAVGEGVSSRGLTEAQQVSRFNTSNIAAQFQDIAVTAAMGMNPMTIALQQGSQLVGVLNLMEKPLTGIVQAFKSLFNTTSLVTIGLTGLVAAGLQMVDWTSVAQSGLNGLASAMDFVANNAELFTSILAGATVALVAFKGAAVTSVLTTGFKSLMTILTSLGGVIFTVLTSPITLTIAAVTGLIAVFANFKDEINVFFGFDFVDVVKSAVNSMIGMFVGALRNVYDLFRWLWDKAKELFGGNEVERSLLDTFANNMNESMNFDYISGASDLISSAASTASAKLKEWSDTLTETDKKTKKLKESWEKLQNQVNQDLASAQLEMRLIGADTYTAEYEKIRAGLTNQALDAGIPLTPEKIAYIDESADSLARVRAETEKANDVFNTSKSITNSFFQDMRTGLRDGASAWESFGNAVTNVLDRILSKMMDVGVDYMFQAIGAAGTSSASSNFSWGNVASSIGSWFSGSSTPVAAANGGVFSNGVYSSPTLFKFAKGGKFGLMGEAGPEAVMPLKRGPDGSLGVRADGMGNNGNVVINVVNNSDAQARTQQRQTNQGTEIDIIIDKMVAEKLGTPGTATNTSLTTFNNRQLIAR